MSGHCRHNGNMFASINIATTLPQHCHTIATPLPTLSTFDRPVAGWRPPSPRVWRGWRGTRGRTSSGTGISLSCFIIRSCIFTTPKLLGYCHFVHLHHKVEDEAERQTKDSEDQTPVVLHPADKLLLHPARVLHGKVCISPHNVITALL